MALAKPYREKKTCRERVVVITSPLPLHNKAGDILLKKMLTVLLGTLDRVSLISGNLPDDIKNQNNIELWSDVDYDTRYDCILNKIVKYGILQLKFSIFLFNNRNRYDTTFFWIASGLLLPVITSKLLKKKTVIMATGNISASNFSLKFFERVNYFLSDVIGVESKSVISHMGLQKHRNKIKILHLFVDDSFLVEKDINKRENIIGYISRLSKEKGIVEFLDAIDLILHQNRDIIILIGSSGPLKHLVKERVKKYGTRVCYLEWIPSNEFVHVLNRIKLLVLPSYTEGLPNIVLEAMACGTPILATPVGGIPDVINDGVTGFLLENNSPECIAETIIRILSLDDLQRISLSGQRKVVDDFSITAAIKDSKIALGWT